MVNRKIVCLGGGIGTVNLIKGLKTYTDNITVVASMADDGGSSGRLRREYGIFPPGDIISCMAAMGNSQEEYVSKLLTYRFPGNRYGNDLTLEGQKLGNLLLAGLFNDIGDFEKSIKILQKILNIKGTFLGATLDQVQISIRTKSGKVVTGEERIDLGKYRGKKDIDEVFLTPPGARVNPSVILSMEEADAIIVGPGDVYSNNIPVLIVEGVAKTLKESKAKKILIVNIANKPHETENYAVSDYLDAFKKHIGGFPFDTVLINNNQSVQIPKKYRYEYVEEFGHPDISDLHTIKKDLLDENFPLYHDPSKLAKAVVENI